MKQPKLKTVYSATVKGKRLGALAAAFRAMGCNVSETRGAGNVIQSLHIPEYEPLEHATTALGQFSWKTWALDRTVETYSPRRVPV